MSLVKRLIVCLDVCDGRVVKGTRFVALRDVGDPTEMAAAYERQGADEIVFLDITATVEARTALLSLASRTAEQLFIPLTIGGGIRTVEDIARALRSGADKVSVNSAAVARPELLTEAAGRFGRQCVVVSIDAARRGDWWEVVTHGGRQNTGLDVVEWARECARRGAGEILLTSIDCDGGRSGYDLELTAKTARDVDIPLIASGGAGSPKHVTQAFASGADAALVAGILHDEQFTVCDIKHEMRRAGMPVREAA